LGRWYHLVLSVPGLLRVAVLRDLADIDTCLKHGETMNPQMKTPFSLLLSFAVALPSHSAHSQRIRGTQLNSGSSAAHAAVLHHLTRPARVRVVEGLRSPNFAATTTIGGDAADGVTIDVNRNALSASTLAAAFESAVHALGYKARAPHTTVTLPTAAIPQKLTRVDQERFERLVKALVTAGPGVFVSVPSGGPQ
jgi:hypothetical protein